MKTYIHIMTCIMCIGIALAGLDDLSDGPKEKKPGDASLVSGQGPGYFVWALTDNDEVVIDLDGQTGPLGKYTRDLELPLVSAGIYSDGTDTFDAFNHPNGEASLNAGIYSIWEEVEGEFEE